jgi:hypothetical protein
MDVGGVTREWIHLFIKAAIDHGTYKSLGYLKMTDKSIPAYSFNPTLPLIASNQSTLTAIGKVVAKSLMESIPLNIYFPHALCLHLLQQYKASIEHLSDYDIELYKGIKSLLEDKIDKSNQLYFTYISEGKEILLRENGGQLEVDESNKLEYVTLVSDYILNKSIHSQVEAFRNGFYSVIDFKIISMLNAKELQSLLQGASTIDAHDWQLNSIYGKPYSKEHKTIVNFWKVIHSFTNQKRVGILQFATSMKSPPFGGFSCLCNQRGEKQLFVIEGMEYRKGVLPKSYTCFNKLLLPDYPNAEELEASLRMVIKYGIFGFYPNP